MVLVSFEKEPFEGCAWLIISLKEVGTKGEKDAKAEWLANYNRPHWHKTQLYEFLASFSSNGHFIRTVGQGHKKTPSQ